MGEQVAAGLKEREAGRLLYKKKKRRNNGGVAQLGEHLPCKQGVKSSNLSVSIVGESLRKNRISVSAGKLDLQ